MKKKLRVIPEPTPNTRTVLVAGESHNPPFRFMRGGGNIDLICGGCGYKLATKVAATAIKNIVLKCPDCSAFNDTEPAPH